MKSLPIVNTRLEVEAVGFCDYEGLRLGVLVTPWFMNLVLLGPADEWVEEQQGATLTHQFPYSPVEFTVNHDERLGSYLSAVLFSTMADMPDQDTARDLALEIMTQLFIEPPRNERMFSRRSLFKGLGTA